MGDNTRMDTELYEKATKKKKKGLLDRLKGAAKKVGEAKEKYEKWEDEGRQKKLDRLEKEEKRLKKVVKVRRTERRVENLRREVSKPISRPSPVNITPNFDFGGGLGFGSAPSRRKKGRKRSKRSSRSGDSFDSYMGSLW